MAEEVKKVDTNLPEAVGKKYKLVGVHATKMILSKKMRKEAGVTSVNFKTISMELADKLAKIEDFPYLVAIGTNTPATGGGK